MTASLLRPSAVRYVRDLNETVVSEFTLRLRRLRTHLQRARVAKRIQTETESFIGARFCRLQPLDSALRMHFKRVSLVGTASRAAVYRIGIWRFRSVSHRVSDPGNCVRFADF